MTSSCELAALSERWVPFGGCCGRFLGYFSHKMRLGSSTVTLMCPPFPFDLTMTTFTNQLLIASRGLDNDFFSRAVVLVLEHHEHRGAAGIVLNKPSEVPLEEVYPELDETQFCREDELVNIGGPCNGPVVALHSCEECTEVPVLPGVAMAVKQDNLHRLLQSESRMRLYSGYSGWAPGQLENEIESGVWYATEASSDLIFGDAGDLWQQACDQYGNEIIANAVGARVPSNLLMN